MTIHNPTIFVVGHFNSGKTEFLTANFLDQHISISVKEYFEVEQEIINYHFMEFSTLHVPPFGIVSLVTHPAAANFRGYWSLIHQKVQGVIILIDAHWILTHSRDRSFIVETTCHTLNFFREHALGRYIVVSNKMDQFPNSGQPIVLEMLGEMLGIRQGEILVSGTSHDPQNVQQNIRRLLEMIDSTT